MLVRMQWRRATDYSPRQEAEFICASSTISQRLAEAFHKNTQPKTFHESVPTYLQDFEDLFAKSSFDRLPDQKVWDHAIKLVPD
jgi:hypothetical protein